MSEEFKWIRSDMSLFSIDEDCEQIISMLNSGDLAIDFYEYGKNFFDAAECVILHLAKVAAPAGDISKLDLWYFAMIYLYRQSLELLLKAILFQYNVSLADRKELIGEVRHDLQQGFEKILDIMILSDDESAKWLLYYFSDISNIDKESDMFRYPFGNNLKVLFDKQTHISLEATYANMNKAYHILNDIYCSGIISKRDYKSYAPQLIIEGGSYYQQSVVGYEYNSKKFYPYYESYQELGDFLKDIIKEENRPNLFMPMCYMYRNAVELGLKRIIIENSHIAFDKALKVIRKKKHSILGKH